MKCFVYPFLAAILTLLGINLEAQSLSGRVLDAKTNEALTGANIIVKSNWRLGTSTDGNGEFTLAFESGLPTDTLLITYIGYEEQEVTYSGFKEQLSIRLQPSATNMNEVVVTAEKLIAEEFTYRKVERLDIYTNPSAKADPLLAVNTLPSSTTLDESANISFRGSSPTETGVFLNNVPIYDAVRFSQLNGIGTFSIFNTAIVENMQIFPGNPPLEYGNTTSGIIAIQTSEDIPEATTYSATLSLASVGVLTSRPINKNSGITAFTNYQPSAIIRGINHEALHKIKKFRSNDLGLNYTKKFRDQSLLKIFNYSLSESYDFQFDAPTYNGTFKQRKNRNLTVANWRKRSNQSEITVNGGVSFSVANFGYSDLNIKIYGRDVFLSANYQYTGELFDIKTGLTYDYRNQIFDGTFYQYDYAIGHGYPTQSESSATGLHRPEVYTYAKYYLGNRWIVGGGLRKNIPAKNQDNYISGQVNLLFQLNDNTSLNAAWGRYNKYNLPQNNNETAYLIKSDQYSLDLRYTNSPLELTSSVFHKESNLPNQTKRITGGEFFIKSTFFNKLTGQASLTFINAQIEESQADVEYPSEYDLNYFIKGSLKYQFNRQWIITTTFLFREGQYYQPLVGSHYDEALEVFEPEYMPLAHQERLPVYNIIDLSLSRLIPLNEDLTIIAFGSVNNILNRKNIREYSYNFNYTERADELFSQRAIYFGAIINF